MRSSRLCRKRGADRLVLENRLAVAILDKFPVTDRHTLGAAFLPMAMMSGLTSAIMDARTPQIVDAVKAADLLLDHDEWGGSWIAAHRKRQAAAGA